MKKIAILDFCFPKGHKNFNNGIIDIVAHDNDVLFTTNDKKSVNGIYVKKRDNEQNKYKTFIAILYYMILQRFIISRKKIEDVIVLSFNLSAYSLLGFLYRKKNVYLYHHNTIDQLADIKKRKKFKKYMNKVYHCVFEEYFKEYLINEIGVDKERVFVIPHPTFSPKKKNNEKIPAAENKTILAISNSNDDKILNDIISYEKEHKVLLENNITLILKSKSIKESQSEKIVLINKFLSEDEYNNYYQKCDAILAPFSDDYKYRTSGTLFDAFSFEKPVIAFGNDFYSHMSKNYTQMVKVFKNIEQLFDIIQKPLEKSDQEIERFFSFHCDNNIRKKVSNMVNNEND